MKVIRKSPEKYGLQKVGKNQHRIVRILCEYASEQEAIDDLSRLLVGEISEDDIIKKNSK